MVRSVCEERYEKRRWNDIENDEQQAILEEVCRLFGSRCRAMSHSERSQQVANSPLTWWMYLFKNLWIGEPACNNRMMYICSMVSQRLTVS